MANFNQAECWLRKGKKITRPSWESDSYWYLDENQSILYSDGTIAQVHLNQLNADDWLIWGCDPVFYEKDVRQFIKELKERLPEYLYVNCNTRIKVHNIINRISEEKLT